MERCFFVGGRVIQKAPELVVHERMSQSKGVKGKKEKKKVKGLSTEEMKENQAALLEKDTEEMREWRDMSQE